MVVLKEKKVLLMAVGLVENVIKIETTMDKLE